ncbi:hypothetical protein TNCV_674061 [Trichonephila clavipes]|uniref:Uncharacterized protein n=1 Tax=Trichonephila clavipes TaxID=2585209 RepID=A0A8X6WEN6_TRICX|nr:hypothetical protein TNCV_674061 [Trichonephila clavipes]
MNVHSRDLMCSISNQVFTRPFCLKRHSKIVQDHQQCDINEEILKEFNTFSVVHYFPKHQNHKTQLEHLRLSESDRTAIAGKLKGVSEKKIFEGY